MDNVVSGIMFEINFSFSRRTSLVVAEGATIVGHSENKFRAAHLTAAVISTPFFTCFTPG